MCHYLFSLFFICLSVCSHTSHTQIPASSKVTTATGVLSSDVFSGKTSSTSTTDILEPLCSTTGTGFAPASSARRISQQVSQANPNQRYTPATYLPSINDASIMNLEQVFGFALVLFLSIKPWLSLYYEMYYTRVNLNNELASSKQRIMVPALYLLLNSAYYQFFNTLKIDMITLLKRASGILLALHLVAQLFPCHLSPQAPGLIIPGNLFSLLSVTTPQARLILVLTHFMGSFLAAYSSYNYRIQ